MVSLYLYVWVSHDLKEGCRAYSPALLNNYSNRATSGLGSTQYFNIMVSKEWISVTVKTILLDNGVTNYERCLECVLKSLQEERTILESEKRSKSYIDGFMEGYVEGFAKGWSDYAIEVSTTLKKLGWEAEEIARYTPLSLEKIATL